MRCPYPIWRDYALADTVYNAATSRQFASGLDIARSIPHPGYRSIAMVSLADAMVLVDHPDTRTTYSEAARAVSSIRVADPRATYAGVLIDSLISAGRFEDARKSVVLLPTVQQKLNALGAVAESMGERELAELANEWIEREAAPADRPFLRRRVNDGLLAALEKSRINQMNRTR
jgi:hypothetical protein